MVSVCAADVVILVQVPDDACCYCLLTAVQVHEACQARTTQGYSGATDDGVWIAHLAVKVGWLGRGGIGAHRLVIVCKGVPTLC